ncbi:MAG TPA: hypothetical protein VGH38_11400 [Bryobacteraceae bacterium]
MELRYVGFNQANDKRLYFFERDAKGEPLTRLAVSVDLALFLKHHIGIQEGPSLCARKLAADLEAQLPGDHELSNDDLLLFVTGRAAKAALRPVSRRRAPQRHPARPSSSFVPNGPFLKTGNTP